MFRITNSVFKDCGGGVRVSGQPVYANNVRMQNIRGDGFNITDATAVSIDNASFEGVGGTAVAVDITARLQEARSLLRDAELPFSEKEALLTSFAALCEASDKGQQSSAYGRFMERAANHAQILSVVMQIVASIFGAAS